MADDKKIIFSMVGVSKMFPPHKQVLKDIYLSFFYGAKIGIIGLNGSGKSTLLKIIAGVEKSYQGEVVFSPGYSVGYLEQEPKLDPEKTVKEVVQEGVQPILDLLAEYEKVNESFGDPDVLEDPDKMEALIARQAELQDHIDASDAWNIDNKLERAMDALRCPPDDQPVKTLSGGERRRVALCRLLLQQPDILLLDEPTNHLDIQSVTWLEDFLKSYAGAFIVISHDRYFLDRVTNRTLEIKNGKLTATNGNYSRHVELMSTRNEILRRHYANQKKEIHRLEGVVEQQRRWGQAHNFITAEAKLKQIERLKAELVAPEKDTSSIHFKFTAREVGGNDVLMCEDLSKSYDKPVFKNASMHIRKGERVFLLGPNGCGKTTLMKIIIGLERQDSGTVRLGAKVQPGYYEQTMTSLDPNSTALAEIHNAYPRMDLTQVRSALAAFLIRGDEVFNEIGALSGGEKARIQLLKLMLSGANLLLLDEPTNHLDISSREALEAALEDYEGTMLIITHDRYLVNRMADRILYMEEDGLTEYIGGYDDYLEAIARRPQPSAEAASPKAEKPNSYKAQKERQSILNRAAGAVRRAEERIAAAEQELEDINQKLASPVIASDYVKSAELAKKADGKQAEIDALYSQWEQAQQALDELCEENSKQG